MVNKRLLLRRFWTGCAPEAFKKRHPELERLGVDVVASGDADVCVYSVFGNDSLPSSVTKVFYTAENVSPFQQRARRPNESFAFALSFSREPCDFAVHKRLPNYAVAGRHLGYELGDLALPKVLDKRPKFCCFMHSNSVPFRENFVRQLSAYQTVDCPGRSLKNIDIDVPKRDTIAFLRQYKFVVCFENEQGDGYVTEKIANAFRAG